MSINRNSVFLSHKNRWALVFSSFIFGGLIFLWLQNFWSEKKSARVSIQKVVLTYQNTLNTKRFKYFVDILSESLKATSIHYGPYEFKMHLHATGAYDLTKHLRQNSLPINIGWGSFKDSQYSDLLSVPIPLYRGTLGMRLFITKSDVQKKINKKFSITDLKRLRIGAVENWDDVQIMKEAQLNVVTAPDLESLYSMLHVGQVDLVSRSVIEAFEEINVIKKKYKNFDVEKNIALSYKNCMYFYFPVSERLLAKRIEQGLLKLYENDKFSKIFESHYGKDTEKYLTGRQILGIENRTNAKVKILQDKKYWFF